MAEQTLAVQPFIHLRRQLHRIPELGFQEFKTQRLLLEWIERLPQRHIQVKTWRTGILVKVQGRNPSRTLAYRTDMDGLPISEQTTYSFQSEHPGYMHACGHDLHMAIAIGLLSYFAEHPLDDHLLFVFQPAEEGPGGAEPMLKSSAFQDWKPDLMMALHIAPEYPVGTIATKPGLLFANTSELFIDFHGQGGHAANPHLTKDMVVAASYFVTQLQTIVSRYTDPLDAAVITVGKIDGGTKQNIIAEKARVEGTIRSLSRSSMDTIKKHVESFVQGIEQAFQASATIDYGANYCQVDNDEQLTRDFMDWVRRTSIVNLVTCQEAMTGEDFGYFIKEIPGFMLWLGVNTPYGLHHAQIEPDEEAIGIAISLVRQFLIHQGKRS